MLEKIIKSKICERIIFIIVILMPIFYNDSFELSAVLLLLVLLGFNRSIFGQNNENSLVNMIKSSKIDFVLTLVMVVEFFTVLILM